jgi:peptidase E
VKTANSMTDTKNPVHAGRSAVQRGLLLAGVLFIFGGESFCLLGPLRYERLVHVICHIVLYTGIVLASVGAILYLARAR